MQETLFDWLIKQSLVRARDDYLVRVRGHYVGWVLWKSDLKHRVSSNKLYRVFQTQSRTFPTIGLTIRPTFQFALFFVVSFISISEPVSIQVVPCRASGRELKRSCKA